MALRSLSIQLKINFPLILLAVLFLHALFLLINGNFAIPFPQFTQRNETLPLKIRDLRTLGAKDSKLKTSTYLSKSDSSEKAIFKERSAKTPNQARSNVARTLEAKKSLSFKDLNLDARTAPSYQDSPARPGTRPGVLPQRAKAINAISLRGNQMKQFTQSDASALSGDTRNPALNNSDVLVNLEVPEGVQPDELNKYELMFYSFQRRTAINYINSFYKNLNKFERENPHLRFPITDQKQVMTGRLTYDNKGNIKQIKMIRWTNEDRLQNFFLDVLKDMDTLHNPPQALWERSGEFTVFFSLVVNG
jgi:hypothetical protein